MSLGKRRINNVRDYDDCDYECESENEIKKGPWKVEEDEVLLNHVEKYGPRDWSSIRSKGLLQRTGKSCRLRWVNKLRPDLKNGVKFSAEEERTVIELQAKFGNKWARIATYLKGRTDNDVKNFWSSRQKRLARILHNSASSSSSNSHYKCNKKVRATGSHRVSSVEAPITDEESFIKSQSCSLPHMDNSQTIKTVPLPELVYPSLLSYEGIPMQRDYSSPMKIELQPILIQQNYRSPVKIEPQPIPIQQNYRSPVKLQPYFSFSEIPIVKMEPPPHLLFPETPEVKLETSLVKPPPHLSFPETPEVKIEPHPHLSFPETPLLQPDFPLPLDQDFIARLGDSSFMEELSGSPQIPIMPSFFVQDQSCEISGTSESFIDDFPPIDMFDHIEPLPSPSEWS